ncbi:MAG: hypothetical protein H7A45_02205 [Verrucomicrobiales bacterium]|nr:hypothetical protein [Verrucomicrobiales bacterium]MCP5526523.1 hypothetical protein [Verrucomicrobiales bacterium]
MALAELQQEQAGIELLQRSLEQGRLGHAYLISGPDLPALEQVARTLAATLSCTDPKRSAGGDLPVDACDTCPACRQVARDVHADVHWLRPESKTRVITVDLMRGLLRVVHMKPNGPGWKVAVLVGAERLNEQAANTFLKTLEEPPERSVLILLSTEPSRVLDTIRSRCLRLNLGSETGGRPTGPYRDWLQEFSRSAAGGEEGLLARYRMIARLQEELGRLRERIQEEVAARSPLQRYTDIEPSLRERWEAELSAAVESEYRRQRGDFLAGLLWWLRDVWLHTLGGDPVFLSFPDLAQDSARIAERLRPTEAIGNLRAIEGTLRLLFTNVQEALALEVGLLRLRL